MTAVQHADLDVRPASGPGQLVNDVLSLARLRPNDAGRLAEVVAVLVRHGVVTAARSGSSFVLHPRQQPPKALAVALRRSFVELGPTFIKFGQLVASSPGLFPAVLAEEFRSLLDDVPPEPTRRIRRIIERQLGARIDDLFTEFDDQPLAAASIAQVHRGRLRNGTDVAIKVRRPHLRDRMERDLRLLRVLATALARVGALGEAANPVAIVEDLQVTMREELDFRREARDMAAFARNLRRQGDNDRIVVPEPIEGLVGERVLVMTFVDGTSVDDGDALRAAGHDLEDLVRQGARAWMESALLHGLFHGDVHAGNLFVTPSGDVAFLDFGIMGRLDDRTRLVLRRLLPAVMIERDYTAVMRAVADLGAVSGPVDLERAGADVSELLEPLVTKPLGELSYGAMLSHVLQVATDHHVRLPRELVAVVKQLLYFERYAKDLAPGYAMFADPAILQHVMAADAVEVQRPVLRTRPRTVELPGEPGGLVVQREGGEVQFSWVYEGQRPELSKLYSKAKRSQWNATTDLDWSVDVDPMNSGGLADYLPLMAAESFERFNATERANAAYQFNAWITSQFLHGEQGALLATAKLVEQVPWVEAKHYGATQVMDEARHVEAYARYLEREARADLPGQRQPAAAPRARDRRPAMGHHLPRHADHRGGDRIGRLRPRPPVLERAAHQGDHPLRDGRRSAPRRLRGAVAGGHLRRDEQRRADGAQGLRGGGGVAHARSLPRHRGVGAARHPARRRSARRGALADAPAVPADPVRQDHAQPPQDRPARCRPHREVGGDRRHRTRRPVTH